MEGVAPPPKAPASLGLTGRETFEVEAASGPGGTLRVTATPDGGEPITFDARLRIDTAREFEYFRHGGILLYAVRRALAA